MLDGSRPAACRGVPRSADEWNRSGIRPTGTTTSDTQRDTSFLLNGLGHPTEAVFRVRRAWPIRQTLDKGGDLSEAIDVQNYRYSGSPARGRAIHRRVVLRVGTRAAGSKLCACRARSTAAPLS